MAVGFTGMLLWWVRTLNELEVTGMYPRILVLIEPKLKLPHSIRQQASEFGMGTENTY